MKQIICLVFLVSFSVAASGQAGSRTGIQFFKGSWSELLDAARQQDKLVFVDVYTEWCGPCKSMDKFIFTQPQVGEKYNAAFLNYKVDAEKGEGIGIAEKYSVGVYPTFLFVDADGYLVHKVIGEKEKGDFIALVDEAVRAAGDENNISNLKKEFDSGNRDPVFLRRYLDRLTELRMDNDEVLDAYFAAIPYRELQNESTLVYLAGQVMGPRTATVAYLIEHYDALSETSKAGITDHLFDKLVRQGIYVALAEKRMMEYKALLAFVHGLPGLNDSHRYLLHRAELKHGVLVRDYAEVKEAGYAVTRRLFPIPVDTIRAEDARRYEAIMRPYLSGEKDSTTIIGFQEDKKYAVNTYSREIAVQLLDAVKAFVQLPDTEKEALQDALAWAKRCAELMPEEALFSDLVSQLQQKLGS